MSRLLSAALVRVSVTHEKDRSWMEPEEITFTPAQEFVPLSGLIFVRKLLRQL